jgi:hypothetical protein
MIRKLMLIAAFGGGAVFMAYHPEYVEYVKEKWEITVNSSEEYVEDLKEESQKLKDIKSKVF